MSQLDRTREQWEGNAKSDALWSILHTSPQQGHWTDEEFFETGRQEIQAVFDELRTADIEVDTHSIALDFGCGVGRLTQALARRFDACIGVDISGRMIELANEYNKFPDTCTYREVGTGDLSEFEDRSFGFVYSSIVLQHVPEASARVYILELCRVLRSGGVAVLQAPSHARLRLVDRLARASTRYRIVRGPLEALRLAKPTSYRSEMHCIPPGIVQSLVESAGCRLEYRRLTNSTLPDAGSGFRYLSEEPALGYISQQYFITRPE
jgi:SAM-dependent methyltransferase